MNVRTGHPDLWLTVKAEQDDFDMIEGSFTYGDETDAQVRKIEREHRRGNVWAWAYVTVTLEYHSEYMDKDNIPCVEGVDYLGCCNYRDVDQFIGTRFYFDGMVHHAINQIRVQLQEDNIELEDFNSALSVMWETINRKYPKALEDVLTQWILTDSDRH